MSAISTLAAQLPGENFAYGAVKAGGFEIRYAAAGPLEAPLIISLPGSAGLEMSIAKDRLSENFRVIELQPPGWGDSEDLDREMDQDEIGRILGEAAQALAGRPYHLIGSSMGGGNALWLAVQYPDHVLSLTLEGSMAPVRQGDLTGPLIRREMIRQMLQSGGPPGGYPAPPLSLAKPWATADYIRDQMVKRFRMMQWVQTDIGGEDLIARLSASALPVLALLGDADGLIRPSVADHYAQVLPGARFVLIPGGEHDLQNTRPDAFVAEVSAFVRRHDR